MSYLQKIPLGYDGSIYTVNNAGRRYPAVRRATQFGRRRDVAGNLTAFFDPGYGKQEPSSIHRARFFPRGDSAAVTPQDLFRAPAGIPVPPLLMQWKLVLCRLFSRLETFYRRSGFRLPGSFLSWPAPAALVAAALSNGSSNPPGFRAPQHSLGSTALCSILPSRGIVFLACWPQPFRSIGHLVNRRLALRSREQRTTGARMRPIGGTGSWSGGSVSFSTVPAAEGPGCGGTERRIVDLCLPDSTAATIFGDSLCNANRDNLILAKDLAGDVYSPPWGSLPFARHAPVLAIRCTGFDGYHPARRPPAGHSLTPIALLLGWNLIGYVAGAPLPVDSALIRIGPKSGGQK